MIRPYLEIVNDPIRRPLYYQFTTNTRVLIRAEIFHKQCGFHLQFEQSIVSPRTVNMVKETPAGFPTWVDKFYFNDILRKEYDQFKVVRFNVEHLNGKGENYASLMFRVKLTVENTKTGLSEKSYVVKAVLQSGMAPEIMEIFNVFPKEIQMYTEFLPKFEEMYKAVGETVRFGPK